MSNDSINVDGVAYSSNSIRELLRGSHRAADRERETIAQWIETRAVLDGPVAKELAAAIRVCVHKDSFDDIGVPDVAPYVTEYPGIPGPKGQPAPPGVVPGTSQACPCPSECPFHLQDPISGEPAGVTAGLRMHVVDEEVTAYRALVRTADITSQPSMAMADALSHACSELGAWRLAANMTGAIDVERSGKQTTPEDVLQLVKFLRERLQSARVRDSMMSRKNALTAAWQKGVQESIDKLYAAAVSGVVGASNPNEILLSVGRIVELLNILREHPP